LTELLAVFTSLLMRQHRHCAQADCRACTIMADVVAIARAHNSLQTFNEFDEIDEPYPLLSQITAERGPATTGATA
jgi:hypothetical protein